MIISSPLEAYKSQTIVFTTEGLDVGYDNPIFACLEINYGEADEDPTGEAFKLTEKALTFYQLDLGLNHVVRKWSEPTERTANLLARGKFLNSLNFLNFLNFQLNFLNSLN